MNAAGASDSRLARVVAWLEHPRLGLRLCLLATLLALPSLGFGFQLDDFVHRYMLSSRPGAAELLDAYQSPFGIANGERASNHWQVEQGYAPWWIYPDLRITLWRPLSELSHRLDAALWPDNAPLQHAHSMVWQALLVLLVTALYRGTLGATTIAGVAAVMYALDHAHGFAVGWIANRNALISAAFGVLALHAFVQARQRPARSWDLLALLAFLLALLSGEGATAIFAYMLGYALFVDQGPRARRALVLLPYTLVLIGWRLVYSSLGRGASFSGLYLDPGREPLSFATAVLERVPWLMLGQLALPPAEAAVFAPESTRAGLFIAACALCALALYASWPLLRGDRHARFYAFGMLAALVVACTTHPNNRLLFFSGIGAMPLLSQLWHGLLLRAPFLHPSALWQRIATGFSAISVGMKLFVSPLLLPLAAASILLATPAANAARSALASAHGRELVIVAAPDYFYAKLIPVLARLEQRPAPHALRVLSFGAVPLHVARLDARTLELRFEGGLLGTPLLELYRARSLVMAVGTRVQLQGMSIEVTALTPDLRIAAARAVFDAPLEDARYCWLSWDGKRYVPFEPPPVGDHAALPPAELPLALE